MNHPNKVSIVTVLTPVVTAIAAALTGWVAKHAPGVDIPTGDLVPLMVLGGSSAAGAALHWLHKQTKVVQLETAVDSVATKVADKVKSDPATSAAAHDLLSKLDAQKDEILKAVADAVQLPPSVEQVAQEILDRAAAQRTEVTVEKEGQVQVVPPSNVVPITQSPVGPVSA